jgi:hypothetical protein
MTFTSGAPMSGDATTRIGPLMGVAFFVLAIAGFLISGEPPDAKESVPDVVDFYVSNAGGVMLGAAVSVLASTCLVFFSAHLRRVLGGDEADGGLLPRAAFAGGLIVAIAIAVDRTMLFAVAATADDIDPLGVQALNALYGNDFLPFALGMQVLLLASGISVIRTRSLPRWLGWTAVALGAVAVSPAGVVSVVGGGLWILAVSVVLGLRSRGSAAVRRAGRVAGVSALLSVALLAVAVGAASAHAGRTQTLRLFSKEVSWTVTHPDGSGDRDDLPEPKPGDVVDVNSLDYVGNHRHHAKRWSISHHLHCVFATAEPDCETQVAIGGSLLIFRGFPGTLIDGTGRYQGASGRVLSNKDVKGVEGASDIVARIHLARKQRAAASKARFAVTSTLDGRKVVPHRIRWLAFPKLNGGEVESVAFQIDGGESRWVEKDPPYTFENGEHEGYLVTSWLTPGEHRFTVRAVASDGRQSTDTVVARVRRAPEPHARLGGIWRR